MRNLIIMSIVLVVIGMITYTICYHSSRESITVTITDKERITESSGSGNNTSVSSKYLVFTENETFENVDEFFLGKFNSSDVQGHLRIDSTYTIDVIGWRIPLFSSYRNIVEIK